MLAIRLQMQVKSSLPDRSLLANLNKHTLSQNLHIGQLSNPLQEVSRLHLGPHHLWHIIYVYLIRVDASTLVLRRHELIPDLEHILQGFLLADHFWLVLVYSEDHSLAREASSLLK